MSGERSTIEPELTADDLALRDRASAVAKAMPSERLLVLADEIEALRRRMIEAGSDALEVSRAMWRHTLTPNAGTWDVDFVQSLMDLSTGEGLVMP